MTNLKKKTISILVLGFCSLLVLLSFQNCGVKGFDVASSIDRNPDTDGQFLPTDSYGITNLTTIPVGKMIEFKMPSQGEGIVYSPIDYNDGKVYAYSDTLKKFISFFPDSTSYEIIEIPDTKKIYIKSVSRSWDLGYNPTKNFNTVLVFFSDEKFKVGYGVFNVKNRTWVRILTPDFDPIQNFMSSYNLTARMLSNPGNNLNIVTLSQTMSGPGSTSFQTINYFQAFDNEGSPLNPLTETSSVSLETFASSDLTPLAPNFVISKSKNTIVDLKTGVTQNLPSVFSSYYDKLIKQDLTGVLHISNGSLNEYTFATQINKKLLSTPDISSPSIRPIDGTFSAFENIYNGYSLPKYLLRSNGNLPVSILGSTFSYSSTNKNLVIFSSDLQASDFKMQVRVFDRLTQNEISLCSRNSPLDSHVLHTYRTDSTFTYFFPKNMRFPQNIYPYSTAVAMDKTCSYIYLGLTYISSDNLTQVSQLYKYTLSSAKTELVFESSSAKSSNIGQISFIGFKNESLIFRFGDSFFSEDRKIEMGKISNLETYSLDKGELNRINFENFQILSDRKILNIVSSNDGNLAIGNPELKTETQPNLQIVPLANQNYIIVSREKKLDTSNSSSIGLYLYNESNRIILQKRIDIPVSDLRIEFVVSNFDYSTISDSFVLPLVGSLSGEDKKYFLSVNSNDLSHKLILRPDDMALNNMFGLSDGSIVSTKYLCVPSANQCIKNPFLLQTESSVYYRDGFFTIIIYQSNLITIARYEYDSLRKVMSKVDSPSVDGLVYSTYSLSKNWLFLKKINTENWIAKNINTGKIYDFSVPISNIERVQDGIFYFLSFNGTELSPWLIDLRQGVMDAYQLKDTAGKNINGASVSQYDYFINKANPDLLGIRVKNTMGSFQYIWSINQKKVLKEIKFERDNSTINVFNSEVLFQTTNSNQTVNDLIKFTWLDLKTMKTVEMEMPQYKKISCGIPNRRYNYTVCQGLMDTKVQLLYWNDQTHSFDILADSISSNLSIYGILPLNNGTALINLREVSDIQKPPDFFSRFLYSAGDISSTSKTYIHRK